MPAVAAKETMSPTLHSIGARSPSGSIRPGPTATTSPRRIRCQSGSLITPSALSRSATAIKSSSNRWLKIIFVIYFCTSLQRSLRDSRIPNTSVLLQYAKPLTDASAHNSIIAITPVPVNGWPVTESMAVNCIPTWHFCEPMYGNVMFHIDARHCMYMVDANAGYVNGDPDVPTAPSGFNVIGPAITTLFVMSSISMAIEVGVTGVFVWSTNAKSMKISVAGYALTLAYGRIGSPFRYLLPMRLFGTLRPRRAETDGAVGKTYTNLEQDDHRIFLNDRSPLGPRNSCGCLPARTCFVRSCTALCSFVVMRPSTQSSVARLSVCFAFSLISFLSGTGFGAW